MLFSVKAFESPQRHRDILSRLSEWMTNDWQSILTALAIGVALYLALEMARSLALRIFKRWATTPKGAVFLIARRAVSRTSHLFMALLSIRLMANYAEPPALLLTTLKFLFTVGAVLQAAIWLREIILGLIDLRADPERGGSEALANASGLLRVLVNTAILALALVVILDNLGVNITGLVAGLGIGGIAIGLAAQGIFSDLFAALSILFDQPFKVGETIAFDGSPATVERIGLKSTRLRAITGETRIVSNAQLLSKDVTSYAGLNRRRFTFAICLIYQTQPDMAERVPEIIREVIESQGGLFVRSGFIGFGASSLDFEAQFDVMNEDWDAVYATRHRIGIALLKRFNELGLSFAYPTQTTFTADPQGRMIMPYAAIPPGR